MSAAHISEGKGARCVVQADEDVLVLGARGARRMRPGLAPAVP